MILPLLPACQAQKAGLAVEQWRVAEIRLASSKPYTNPFIDVDVSATFTGPGGEKVQRLPFWDGTDIPRPVQPSSTGEGDMPPKPDAQDWLLVVQS